MVVDEYQQKFVKAWRERELDIGEFNCQKDFIVLSKVEFKDTKVIMKIDVNEKKRYFKSLPDG